MKFEIAMLVPGMPFSGDSMTKISIGGSETSGLAVARELANLGHTVRLFCNTDKPEIYDGVFYVPANNWATFVLSTPHDIAIVQRMPDQFMAKLNSKLNILWCHDMGQSRNSEVMKGILWNVDNIFVLSDYMKQQYLDVYNMDEKVLYKTRNGIDLDLVPKFTNPRNKKRLVYSARPERGLDTLLDRVFPKLLERDPEFELVFCGYDNKVEHMIPFYEEIGQKAQKFGNKVQFLGCLTKPELYKLYSESGIYVYPTPSPSMPEFREIFCISMLEAGACGLPIVASNLGALPETLPNGAGVLIDGDPQTDEYVDNFVDSVLGFTRNEAAYNQASEMGIEKTKNLGWDKVAEDWSEHFDELITNLNDDKCRLAYHFVRRSDIMMARELVEDAESGHELEIKKTLDEYYGFIDSKEAFKEHYLKGGKLTDDRLSSNPDPVSLFTESPEPRYAIIKKYLEEHSHINRILDFGCGHGWCDVYMENNIGRNWVGVDIDSNAVKWSKTYSDKYSNNPDHLKFYEGDEDVDLSNEEPFDCLIISEVLEHLPNPTEVVNKLEKWVKPGGTIIITVPYGPAEFYTWNWMYFRNHIWEFDHHDINDMFKDKTNFDYHAAVIGENDHIGEVVGFYFITYEADHKPVGEINIERKLKLQRPKQTISAAVIAGGEFADETMHWCLRSLRPVVDEIIIGDCGLSQEGKRIANMYADKMIEAANPIKAGFETPRNEVLEQCRMDWVIWQDTDEKLVDGKNLTKYLKQNMFHGYALRQHHFTVDAGFRPDLPVRFYRRGEYDGRKIRHVGYIHEHPEFGMNEGPGPTIVLSDIHVAHLGYLAETGRKKRFWRNHPLLQKDIERYPDRRLQKYFICRDNMMLAGYDVQNNGGRITDYAKQLANEVCDIYREYFLGKPCLTNTDVLQYYSQALQVLGKGIDVSFNIAANRDGIGDDLNGNGGINARFLSYEEAKKEMDWRLKESMDRFEKPYW